VALCFADRRGDRHISVGALAIHFVRFDPGGARWRALPVDLLEHFVFTGWPEEFLFRGLLQRSLLSKLAARRAKK